MSDEINSTENKEQNTSTNVMPVDLNQEMKSCYLDYAMSVIVSRAIPDVRDGLKPVHRRILYSMHTQGMTPEKPHRKSAHIVGNVLANFHPHGDAAVYDAMVRLAQDFSTRYLLVDGHGNFGSVDGDSAAHMRYTEARMAKITSALLADIEKDTVDFVPNYDNSTKEPTVLPSKFPNILVNGTSGIAVGMATNIPPHNLGETIDGLIALIDDPDITIAQLMKIIKGPDFPTYGQIMGRQGIKAAYETGRGTIKVRAVSHIEKISASREAIVVTEIPYIVNKARLIERIAELARDKKIEGISDLRDESDRKGMRIVIELKKDVNPEIILNQLYKHTRLQDTFGIIMLVLVNGEPKILNLKEILSYYLAHQEDVVVRRTKHDLEKAEARAHILEGLRIALNFLDEVIKIIRSSGNDEEAKNGLMSRFGLSEIQAQAILDMRLRRLTALEREKLEEEYAAVQEKIAYYRSVLGDERLVLKIIKEEITAVKEKFGDKRRTRISAEVEDLDVEDLIADENVVVTMTYQGYIKRLPLDTYRGQRRGGRGITALGTKEDDFVRHLFTTTTHSYLLFFTNKGRVYRLKVYEIPEAGRQAKGTAIVNLLHIDKEEKVTALIPIRDFSEEKYLLMGTKNGIIKRSRLDEYDSSRRDGLIALNLDKDDLLLNVRMSDGNGEIVMATQNGLAIRFAEKEVRCVGRTSRGVKGVNLAAGDICVGMEVIDDFKKDLLVVTENGYGKKTALKEYHIQARAGKGNINVRTTRRNGCCVAIRLVDDNEDILLITNEGVIIRFSAKEVVRSGRSTQGVRLIKLQENDKLVAMSSVEQEEKAEDTAE